MSLESRIVDLTEKKRSQWAWANYLPTVRAVIAEQRARAVIEIGGGRAPALTREEIDALGIEYTCSDIMASELARAPEWVKTAHFDVQTDDKARVAPFAGSYDIVFSRMVMEHVESYERAYSNIYDLLRPGGVSLAFHPVYYALPFVVNAVLPEHVTRAMLARIFPNRNNDEIPKFPAYYSGCRISRRIRERLTEIGFSDVWQVPFYGHTYYGKFPVVREIHAAATKAITAMDFRLMSSFCYTIVRK